MYKTTGIIDKEFYESTKCHVYPKKRIVLLKICIAIIVVGYLMEAFLIKDLKWTLICVFALSLYSFAYFYALKKYTKMNLKRLQESYHADSIEMSTEFTEDAMLISSTIRPDVTEIYYQDISRVVLTSKYYLIFTKAEQLICVFADQLQERDRLGLIGFLKEKVPKIKIYKEKPRRKYFIAAGLIAFYVSFVVFLIGYFKNSETSMDVEQNMQTEALDAETSEESENNEVVETEQTETNEFTYQIENPSWEYYCSDEVAETENISFELEQIYEVENDITDLDDWMASNEITVPQFPYSDEKYSYTFTGVNSYETTNLMIFEFSGDIYHIDMNEFSIAPDKVYEANDPFTDDRGYVNFAKIKDGILYVSTGHKGYTTNNPSTGYITAIDLENGEVLWKSAPQVSNAYNFEIIDDVIICGYGFTDEDDFLYILNRTNGQVMEQIPLKSMAEYIVAKDSTLYVRTYNRNYEFRIYSPKIIYEGCYFDEGVYQYWTSMPITESPMIYCEIWISNVTETTFDFLIKEVVMATDERTIVLPLSTAKIVNNGWGAIYEGEEFTLSFEFPDAPDVFPKYITVDGWEKLEGNTYMNKEIPGHESG